MSTIPENLLAIVQRKQYEAKKLISEHSDPNDPLQLRLGYMANKSNSRLRTVLRRVMDYDQPSQIAVIADIKRRSPTAKRLPRQVLQYEDVTGVCQSLSDAGTDALMLNTDTPAWGGSLPELREAVKSLYVSDEDRGTPIIMKDIIVHPLQLAQAVEQGAAGVVLVAVVLGPALEDFMNAATIMGTEVLVEVHTPNEAEKAMEYGANVIMVNNWDRLSGELRPSQAAGIRDLLPHEIITVAAGGIETADQIARLADTGYDAVVLGRALATHSDVGGLIRDVRNRQGLSRPFLGMGISPEDLRQ